MSIKYKGKTIAGGGSGAPAFTTDDTLTMSKENVLGVTTPVRGVTQAEYDALTEEQQKSGMYVITDAVGNGGGSSENGEVYSTEEVKIGTWIDGKPLYRKCFSFLYSDSTLNTYKTVAKVEEPIDIPAHIFGTRLNNTKACYSIPNIAIMIRITSDGEIQIYQSSTGWSGTYYVTVEYTKTTDQEAIS